MSITEVDRKLALHQAAQPYEYQKAELGCTIAGLLAQSRQLSAELAEAKRELAVLADFLHARSEHPAYEYTTTTGPRKAFDDYDLPPDGEDWEPNVHSGNDDAWSRLEYHEERYWRRLWVDKDHETGAPVWADWHVPSQAVVSEAVAHAVTVGAQQDELEWLAEKIEQEIFDRNHKELCGCDQWPYHCQHFPQGTHFSYSALEVLQRREQIAESTVNAAESTADGPEQTDGAAVMPS